MEEDKQNNNHKEAETSNMDDELKEKITQLEKERDDYLNGWKRAKADYINYQKDEMKRFSDAIKYGNEDLIKELLPVLDSFELSYMALGETDKKIIKGFEVIHSQLENILKKNGLEPIKSLGSKFDPNIHEAATETESKEKPGTVVEELIKGWKLNGKVIRPAKVKIAK